MSPEQEDRIKQRAYEIWEREGRPEGRGDVHWHMAAQEIRAEDGWVDDAADPAGPTDDLGRQMGSAEASLSTESAAAEEAPPAEAVPVRKTRTRKTAAPKAEEAPPSEPKAKGRKAAAPKAASEKPKRSAKA
ncbi:DUF2934 domain-containing protein [Skermanella mucosa]|uniref:DUF2934 domain-containing protein n=1 Tax=Skermanella mucosa TaxID=1789672 RepID=UPI00192BA0C4|nr:DUF2934 domain-containing protein [Skermanella mucosa]UEM23878.1 DUF2934 domain-containing protein [Skermanella mucosa]